ncbi:diguanylate cyclase [Chitinimonas sp.]|uniref:diguanylate cyclase n=1 Tax=Chitinimonas sp. TaxID=1934313 RepID=UPI0035B4BFFD
MTFPADSRRHSVKTRLLASLVWLALCTPALAANPDWEALDRETERDAAHVKSVAQQYVDQYHRAGDRRQELEALAVLVDANLALNDYATASALVERGLPLAHSLDAPKVLLSLTWSHGQIRQQRGDHIAALADFDAALKLAREHGFEEERAGVLIEKARILQEQSRFNDALPLLFEAHGIFERLHKANEVSKTLGALADAYARLGDETQAVDYYRRAIDGLTKASDAMSRSNLSYNLAGSLFNLNQLDEAERILTRELANALKLRDAAMIGFIRYRLGTIAEKRGWEKTALAYYDAALPAFVKSDDFIQQFNVQTHRAQLLAVPDAAAAMAAFDEARRLLHLIETPYRRMDLHDAGSKMYKRMGRYADALAELEQWVRADQTNDAQFNRQAATEMQVRFDAKAKEIENALLKSEQRRQAAELHASRNGHWLLLIGLASSLAMLSAVAFLLVYQVRQKRRYADLAMLDELTGAPNRRHIIAYAQRQLEACRSVGSDFSLAVIDLDNFKAINDRCGHEAGDAALKAFAQASQGELRRGDRLGRLGGEEWLLVMPSAKQDELHRVFERLRSEFQLLRPASIASDIELSFSMGVAQAQAGESFERLLARADAAMYSAKQSGRDQLVLADVPPIPPSAFEPDG